MTRRYSQVHSRSIIQIIPKNDEYGDSGVPQPAFGYSIRLIPG